MSLEHAILGFLNYRALSGYDLKKIFSVSFTFFSDLSYGSIYPALKKLEQQGLITMKLEIQESSPNRKSTAKIFDGEDAHAFVQATRPFFEKTKRVRPDAVRKESREFFLVCLGFKGRA